ncbi:hypothetical protein [Nocardia sp. BMG111209]|uniref:hypothetical protein n=1 Tax=Nocardia sp. BMG111209 TaxID=1160137 RepID=UPI00036619BA|nr:hypothetical protein [Nocardia sp. BMG111209]
MERGHTGHDPERDPGTPAGDARVTSIRPEFTRTAVPDAEGSADPELDPDAGRPVPNPLSAAPIRTGEPADAAERRPVPDSAPQPPESDSPPR